MSIDLGFDDGQAGIATALSQFCEARCGATVVKGFDAEFPHALWQDLASLGVLAVASEEGEGGAREVVAAMETLGIALFPGPLAATLLATQLSAPEERAELTRGMKIAAVGRPPLFPFATVATIFFEVEGDDVYRVRPRGAITPVDTLGGEVWGRIECERTHRFDDASRALALYRIALAAYLVGASAGLLRAAAAHAATRKQFRQPIGQFQAVAHPLADVHIRTEAARLLARSAADQLERDARTASFEASAAHYSARRAAIDAAHTCHQVFGASGITLEGPAYHYSRRIMQLAALAPPPEVTAEGLYRESRRAARQRNEQGEEQR